MVWSITMLSERSLPSPIRYVICADRYLPAIEADNSKAKRKAASRQITVQDGDTDVLNSNEDEAGVGSLFHIGSSED